MKILALDPATKCGFAHSNGVSGTWDLSIRRDESAGMRLVRLNGKLREILDNVGVDLLIFEAARHAAPKMQGALVVQAEFQAIIKVFCEDNKITYQGVSPSEIKKFATGKGNANKAMMIEQAKRNHPEILKMDDNEADALHILDFAKDRYETEKENVTKYI